MIKASLKYGKEKKHKKKNYRLDSQYKEKALKENKDIGRQNLYACTRIVEALQVKVEQNQIKV